MHSTVEVQHLRAAPSSLEKPGRCIIVEPRVTIHVCEFYKTHKGSNLIYDGGTVRGVSTRAISVVSLLLVEQCTLLKDPL